MGEIILFEKHFLKRLKSFFNAINVISLQKQSLLVFVLLLAGYYTYANNISVNNVRLTGQNTISDYVMVQFDISWENSWRISTGPGNWDAAWIFVKYRVASGVWNHSLINTTGNIAPAGSNITVPSDNMGAFIYRSADGTGTFTKTGVQLRWNYGSNGLGDDDIVDIRVYAIEMVYVPQASFYIGSGGTEISAFYKYPITTDPYQITSEGAIAVGTSTDNLYYAASTNGGDQSGPIPADFPKGYSAFYCMKYEITEQAYVDFLNTLDRTQQDNRTETSLSVGITSVTNRYVMSNTSSLSNRNGIRCNAVIHTSDPIIFYCDLNGNDIGNETSDGQWIACNYLSWADVAAYLDWAGLRPMTDLEFEKACRGDKSPVANEYIWGNTSITSSVYTLNNGGSFNEEIATNYSITAGNASYLATDGSNDTPLRVGIFAANNANVARITSGSSYYGVMEIGGNLWERIITIGNSNGRTYDGMHGDGLIDATGDANVSNWPGTDAIGIGFRGGSWNSGAIRLRVSDRNNDSYANYSRANSYGGRGVRIVP